MDLNEAGKFLERYERTERICRDFGFDNTLLTLAKAGLELATDLGRVAVHAEDAQTRSVARGLNLKFAAALKSTEAK